MDVSSGKKVALNCTAATVVLAVLKGIVGVLSGSVALIADALHSTSDIFIIFATFIGLKISEKAPDKKFPYGYYKAETFATFVVSIFIVAAGVLTFFGSVHSLKSTEISFDYVAMGVAAISAIASYFISIYEIKVGKKINSSALLLNGYESRMDIITSLAVLVGVAASHFGVMYVEGAVGIFISFLLVKYGLKGLYESVFILMDASPEPKMEKKIKELVTSTNYVKRIKSIKLRKSGMVVFGDMTILVKGNINVERVHEISEEIEWKIKKAFPQVNELNIHVEPEKESEYVVSIPVNDESGEKVAKNLSRAPYFALFFVKEKNVERMKVVPNPYVDKKVKAGLSIGKFLSQNSDVVITKNIGEISFHVLRDNFVDIYKANSDVVADVVKDFVEGKLEKLEHETREVE